MPDDIAAADPTDTQPHLRRDLANRHIQLIAIGGAIGTGLFMGSGRTISLAGPAVMVVYGIIGFFVFFVLRAMGELLLSNLNYKSFVDFAADLLGPAAGFFVGWSYWFAWVVTGIADLVAITGYARFWWPGLPIWVPALVTVALIRAVNLFSVRHFGELEFWFALIKVAAIVCLIAVGAILVATNFVSPHGVHATIENLWNDNGFFPTGFLGVVSGFQIAFFAYIGVELVGTAAAETADPRRTLPRAINAVPLRVAVFYIGALLAILAVVPWRQFASGESPVCDDVLPSRTCRCGVGRQLRRGHRSGLVSELRLLLHRANAFRPRRRRPRSGRFPPTQSRRRARTRPAADGSATADLHPAALCRSVGDWGVHTRHDGLIPAVHVCVGNDHHQLPRLPSPTPTASHRLGVQDARWRGDVLGRAGVFRVRDLDTYHRNRNRNRVGVVPAMVRAARRGLARHPAPAEPPQLWFSLPGRRGSSAARPRYGQACNENPRAAQTPKCGRRRASVSR